MEATTSAEALRLKRAAMGGSATTRGRAPGGIGPDRGSTGNRTLADIPVGAVDCALSDKEPRDGRIRTRATIRNHADALRAFFRFAEDRGWCRPGLAATITSPRVYKNATLPAGPSAEDLERLLATTEGDQPEDLRDLALLLTLSVYGLRAGEARGLRLDDIDGGRGDAPRPPSQDWAHRPVPAVAPRRGRDGAVSA